MKKLMMILELRRQGLSVLAISERTGHDRRTVRKYSRHGLAVPGYKPREPDVSRVQAFEAYLRKRGAAWPELTSARLLREIRELGYRGGNAVLNEFLREVRPPPASLFAVRFEMPAGRQAQGARAEFKVQFADDAGAQRKVWLFALVLGHSRSIKVRFRLMQPCDCSSRSDWVPRGPAVSRAVGPR